MGERAGGVCSMFLKQGMLAQTVHGFVAPALVLTGSWSSQVACWPTSLNACRTPQPHAAPLVADL